MNISGSALNLLNGINSSSQQLQSSNQRIAEGDISAQNIVDSKVAETGIKAQLTSVKSILETEEAALDILA